MTVSDKSSPVNVVAVSAAGGGRCGAEDDDGDDGDDGPEDEGHPKLQGDSLLGGRLRCGLALRECFDPRPTQQ